MMVTISSIAYAVRTASESAQYPIQLSYAQQLVAAALGYKSLAAYQASLASNKESKALDEAAHFVLDVDLLFDRANELKLPHSPAELTRLLEVAFKERLPAAQIHSSEMELDDYIRDLVQQRVLNDEDTASAMAMTNNDGIAEIYLPFDDVILADLPPLGETLDVDCEGHVSMDPDLERPYSGHKIDVSILLTLERKGRTCITEPICEVVSARLDYDWLRDDEENDVPTVSLAQALADELELQLSEAEELVDAEPVVNQSDDGLVYSYIYDFSPYASPAVAEKLVAKHGSLIIELSPTFFEQVDNMEYY